MVTLGPPNSPICQNNINACVRLFGEWGIPLAQRNWRGPSTCMTVLGIELSSLTLQVRLPREKFDRISALLETWSTKKHCTRKELEFLIGNLQHVCKIIPQGCPFFSAYEKSFFRRDDHPIRLNQKFRLDLPWWREFFLWWDGFSFSLSPQWASLPDFHVSSDALCLVTALSKSSLPGTWCWNSVSLPRWPTSSRPQLSSFLQSTL